MTDFEPLRQEERMLVACADLERSVARVCEDEVVEQLRLHELGDGASMTAASPDWTVEDVWTVADQTASDRVLLVTLHRYEVGPRQQSEWVGEYRKAGAQFEATLYDQGRVRQWSAGASLSNNAYAGTSMIRLARTFARRAVKALFESNGEHSPDSGLDTGT